MKKAAGTSFISLLFVTTALVVLPNFASASPASVPSSAEPGVVMRGLEREHRAPTKLEAIVTSPSEENAGKGLSTQKVFELQKVVLDGSTVYSADGADGFYSDLAGKTVSFADLNVIAQRMTKRYRDNGYIFSYVVLPPQKVSGGVVHLRAVEGHISSVKLVGNYHDEHGLIKKMADRIDTSGAANSKQIERYLMLINDLPGITARSKSIGT